jgi:DNA-directed RNA polymerase specialized sigma24 family protein
MTPEEFREQHAAMLEERRFLASLAFQILGSVTGAERAVQESYVSWYLSMEDQGAVEAPRAWLTRYVARTCLNRLVTGEPTGTDGSKPWLPDNGRETELTTRERVAMVLSDDHGMPFEQIGQVLSLSPASCERMADSARARSQTTGSRLAARASDVHAVSAFASAARQRDRGALLALMAPDVELLITGDSPLRPVIATITGGTEAVNHLLAGLERNPTLAVLEQETPVGIGVAVWDDGRIVAAAALNVRFGAVAVVRVQDCFSGCC